MWNCCGRIHSIRWGHGDLWEIDQATWVHPSVCLSPTNFYLDNDLRIIESIRLESVTLKKRKRTKKKEKEKAGGWLFLNSMTYFPTTYERNKNIVFTNLLGFEKYQPFLLGTLVELICFIRYPFDKLVVLHYLLEYKLLNLNV